MALIFVIIAAVLIYLFKWYTSPVQKYIRAQSRGKNEQQKKVIRYFVDDSFLGKFLKMKDDEYLQMVSDVKSSLNLKAKALEKLGVDEDQVKEITPLELEGWRFDKAYAKKNDQGKYISSKYCISWVFCSDDQLYLYQYYFDMDEDKKKETTHEFFYSDITSVSTASDTEKCRVITKGIESSVEVDNESLTLVVPGDKIYISMSNDTDDVTDTIKGIKQKIMDAKKRK